MYTDGDYSQYKTIVLANGQFPESKFVQSHIDRWIQDDSYMLACCDGAVNSLKAYTNKLPDLVVGDLDSVAPVLKEELASRIIHIAEQDTNDLTKTISYLTKTLGKREILLLGASGKREDHMLGNLSLLCYYADWLDELAMLTDTGLFRLIKRDSSIEVGVGTQVSIFNFQQTPISLKGVHWPLENYILPYLYSGTLNRADEAVIHIETTNPILLFTAKSL